jgi:hypothetical protein
MNRPSRVSPPGQEVVAGDVFLAARGLVVAAVVGVALQADHIAGGRGPIHPEAALRLAPMVAGLLAGSGGAVGNVEVLGVEAPSQILADAAAVLHAGAAALRANLQVDGPALSLFGGAGDDVDHPVDRIGAPQGGAGTADHLDTLDVLGQDVLHVPVDALEQGRIDRAAIDQHQQLVGEILRLGITSQPPRCDDTCRLGARRRISGMLAAPERTMSSWVMT